MPRQRQREPFPNDFSNPWEAAKQFGRWYWSWKGILHAAPGITFLALSFFFGEGWHGVIHAPGVAHFFGALAAINLVVPAIRFGYRWAGGFGVIVALAGAYLLLKPAGLDLGPILIDKFHILLLIELSPLPIAVAGCAYPFAPEKTKSFARHVLARLFLGRWYWRRVQDRDDRFVY